MNSVTIWLAVNSGITLAVLAGVSHMLIDWGAMKERLNGFQLFGESLERRISRLEKREMGRLDVS